MATSQGTTLLVRNQQCQAHLGEAYFKVGSKVYGPLGCVVVSILLGLKTCFALPDPSSPVLHILDTKAL
jgi:hypothetical protein